MTIKSTLIVLALFLFAQKTTAQDSFFEAGMQAYRNKDYPEAMSNFDAAIEDKYLMKGKNVPRAYNFRAKSVAEYFKLILNSDSLDFISKNPNILVNAFDDLDQAIKFDDGRCHSEIAETKTVLLDVTFTFGQTIADSLQVDRGSNNPETDSLVRLVIDELLVMQALDEQSYQINDLLGILAFKTGDNEKAISYFDRANKLFISSPPLSPDFRHVYNYYYLTLIQFQNLQEFDLALASASKARNYLKNGFETNSNFENLDSQLEALQFQITLLND